MLSTSAEVNQIVSDSFPILTFYVFIEPLSKVITGVITGLGKQATASVVTLIGYWVVGIPLTIFYIWLHYGEESIFGIWLGASVSLVFILLFQYWIVHGTNYQQIVLEANLRRRKDEGESDGGASQIRLIK